MRSPTKTRRGPGAGAMAAALPLSTLLSQVLVAFTIELDNEFERQMPHRTARHGSTPGARNPPWLMSMVMWLKFMRFISSQGVSVRDLQLLSRLRTEGMAAWLTRMRRWGYVEIEPRGVVRLNGNGRQAQSIWQPLTATIERRWEDRFGKNKMSDLRKSLSTVVEQLDPGLPDYLPILGYRLFSRQPEERSAPAEPDDASRLSLSALLAKALLAFAIEFERDSSVSLAIAANVLRLAGDDSVRVRDLPRLAGVSKEAIAMCLSFLEKRDYAVIETEAASRFKSLFLTPKGRRARDRYCVLIYSIEERWRARFGEDAISAVRATLEDVVGEATPESPLFHGLEPYTNGWRAAIAKPEALPHYPMVLHRGGYPDGS